MRRSLALALLLLAAAAAPARADETIAQLTEPGGVDAWGGRLVWSEPAGERFRLMTRLGTGPVEAVPVRTRAEPFDVDLGPRTGGGMVAAYSRAGDLYAYDFTARTERKLARQSTSEGEFLPAIWRSRVAFVRAGRLFVQKLAGGKAREVRGGRGSYDEIDLHDRRVAFVRDRSTRGGDRLEYQLLIQRGTAVARLVDRAASGLLSSVAIRKPAFEGGALVYAITRFGAAGNRFYRYDLRTRHTIQALGRRGLLAAAFDAGRFLYLRTSFDEDSSGICRADTDDPSTCTLGLTDPVAF
jgi:hypothetical protein